MWKEVVVFLGEFWQSLATVYYLTVLFLLLVGLCVVGMLLDGHRQAFVANSTRQVEYALSPAVRLHDSLNRFFYSLEGGGKP